MSLIQIDRSVYVAADQVAQVFIRAGRLIVETKSGEEIYVEPDYGKPVFDKLDRLVKEINDATQR